MVGVINLLAHIGCFVPAEFCSLSILDGIFCRVGAGDSLIHGKSTFMNEMLEASGILNSATSDSLVLIDELGRGTSNHDGFGLAWAILEFLAKDVNCFTLFATHYHQITELSNSLSNCICKKVDMQITDGEIVPLYKIVEGACHESYGIKIAKLAGFPTEMIELAENIQHLIYDNK
eukprot:NODE_628_length_5237_cov_0.539510.p4 type:complete len:176 gc:universal NODE_628_length_5237_cov_0.539510:2871-2344(-)